MTNSRTNAWMIWAIASIFYAYQYIIRVMPSVMKIDLMDQFSINEAMFGQFSGVYYIGYALFHLPIGIMLDKYGPKKVMSICMLLVAIGLMPIIFSEKWIYPVIGRLFIGIGSSAAILGAFKIIRMCFSKENFTSMLSICVTIGLFGAIYGGAPVKIMSDKLGYKIVVEIFAILAIVLAAITYKVMPELEKKEIDEGILKKLATVFGNKKVMAICLCSGLMVGPIEGFADIWGPAFLIEAYGFDNSLATFLPSLIFFGMCFGAPVLSFIADKTGRHYGAIIGAGIFMLVVFSLLITKMIGQIGMSVGFFIVGICCAYQIVAIYKASTYVPDYVSGLTTAVTNMIIMVFGYAFHSVIGIVVQFFVDSDKVRAYIYGIGVVPAALLIGTIGFMLIALSEMNKEEKAN